MPQHGYTEFIEHISEMNLIDMIYECQRRIRTLEGASFGVRGAVAAREAGSVELAERIKGIAFWLGNGIKPTGLSDWEFLELEPLCEKLIAKGQLVSAARDEFAGVRNQNHSE